MADRTPHTVCGLAEPLPLGETVFWQGRPDRGSLARHAFHSRKILIYFALLVGIRVFFSAGQPLPIRHFLAGAIPLAGLALVAWGLAHLTAWLTRRASCYAITDRRVVLRMGIAIPTAVNLPLASIDAVALRLFRDGTGDLALTVDAERLSYILFWPHVRGWRLTRPQPALRSVPDAERAAAALRRALQPATPPARPDAVNGSAQPPRRAVAVR